MELSLTSAQVAIVSDTDLLALRKMGSFVNDGEVDTLGLREKQHRHKYKQVARHRKYGDCLGQSNHRRQCTDCRRNQGRTGAADIVSEALSGTADLCRKELGEVGPDTSINSRNDKAQRQAKQHRAQVINRKKQVNYHRHAANYRPCHEVLAPPDGIDEPSPGQKAKNGSYGDDQRKVRGTDNRQAA